MKQLIWLDDMRNPFEGNWLRDFSPIIDPYETTWVKNYNDFIQWIKTNGLPDAICFDHDLGEDIAIEKVKKGISKKKARLEKKLAPSGYDCVKWLVDYCLDHNLQLPIWNVQSSNTVGRDNINGIFKPYIKHIR